MKLVRMTFLGCLIIGATIALLIGYINYRTSFVTLHAGVFPARVAADLETLKRVNQDPHPIGSVYDTTSFEVTGSIRCKIVKWAHDFCPCLATQQGNEKSENAALQITILEGAHTGETVWACSSNIWFGPRL